MFIKEHGTAAILLAAIFLALGFMLGKVTGKGHHGCNKGHHKSSCNHISSCNHGKHSSNSDFVFHSDDHMIIVESMMSEGFQGDTILTIPGGEIHMSIDGDNVDVRVDVDEESLHEHGEHGEHDEHKEVKVVKVIKVDED
jgi:hypothetical protein